MRALAVDGVPGVEGVDQGEPGPLLQGEDALLAVGGGHPLGDHGRPERPHRGDLGRIRPLGHHHGAGEPEAARGQCDRLAVVPGADRDHPGGVRREPAQAECGVEGPAHLEGAGRLQQLRLDHDAGEDLVGGERGGAAHVPRDERCRRGDGRGVLGEEGGIVTARGWRGALCHLRRLPVRGRSLPSSSPARQGLRPSDRRGFAPGGGGSGAGPDPPPPSRLPALTHRPPVVGDAVSTRPGRSCWAWGSRCWPWRCSWSGWRRTRPRSSPHRWTGRGRCPRSRCRGGVRRTPPGARWRR